MKTRRAITEVAPRAFEVALHYASALSGDGYAKVLAHDLATGLPVEDCRGADVPPSARRALEHLGAGRYAVVKSRLHTASLDCPALSGHEHRECLAVADAAVGGEGWFVACRLVWAVESFADSACARQHDQIIVAVDRGEQGMRVVRLRFEDAQGVVLRKLVREALLRDLVLRPGFGVDGKPHFPDPLPRAGDGSGSARR